MDCPDLISEFEDNRKKKELAKKEDRKRKHVNTPEEKKISVGTKKKQLEVYFLTINWQSHIQPPRVYFHTGCSTTRWTRFLRRDLKTQMSFKRFPRTRSLHIYGYVNLILYIICLGMKLHIVENSDQMFSENSVICALCLRVF